jgi:hypothetical protein
VTPDEADAMFGAGSGVSRAVRRQHELIKPRHCASCERTLTHREWHTCDSCSDRWRRYDRLSWLFGVVGQLVQHLDETAKSLWSADGNGDASEFDTAPAWSRQGWREYAFRHLADMYQRCPELLPYDEWEDYE